MLPSALTPASFATYLPEARALAIEHLSLLQATPLALLPSLLHEVMDYDVKFPVERAELAAQLSYVSTLNPAQRTDLFAGFASIRLAPELTQANWCARPAVFNEQLSAYLWQTHQMPAYRAAATAYGDRLQAAHPPAPLAMPRLGIAVIGQGAVPHASVRLFTRLRVHGTCFDNVDPSGGLATLLDAVETRATRYTAPYTHWYVDGGTAQTHSARVTGVSYGQLAPVRTALLDNIGREVGKAGMGPEQLRDHLMHLAPADLGMTNGSALDHFQLKILTEGSGTQIFATTFAQWTAREALRRAQALTLLVRFQPRQHQRTMNELLANSDAPLELDPQGSLIDADMAAYYQWIDQQRLPGAAQSTFLAWFEGQHQAVAIGPAMPRNAESHTPLTLSTLLAMATG